MPQSVLRTVVFVNVKFFEDYNLDLGFSCRLPVVYWLFTASIWLTFFCYSYFFCDVTFDGVVHVSFQCQPFSRCCTLLVVLDCVIRGLDLCRLALNHLFWLWFVWLMLLVRHPGVSHQFCKREFTAHLKLSIRRGALFPLLRFQLTGTDEPWTESSALLDLEFVRALERNPGWKELLRVVAIC